MGTGSLALAMLLLATAAPPSDVIPMNARGFKIPIQIGEGQRDKIRELILYVSTDQGITWNQVGLVKPDQDAFKFYAPADGLYWFNICLVDNQGNRQPADIYKTAPRTKILVDTLKPGVRITSAERQGDDVTVKWEITDDHPDLSTLKLEYRTPESPSWMWFTASATPALTGQTTFHFDKPDPITLRLQMMDVAGNLGSDQKEIIAKAVNFVVSGPANPPPATALSNPATGALAASPATLTAGAAGPALGGSALPAPDMGGAGSSATQPLRTPAPLAPPPIAAAPARNLAGSNWEQMAPVQQAAVGQTDARAETQRPWGPSATYRSAQANPNYPDSESRYNALATNAAAANEQSSRPPASRWQGGAVVPLQITNNPQVSLDYEVTKVGHSGVGRVALYLTKDEGRTWELYGEDPDLKPPMVANLPGEGIYGLRIVVTSRAGLGGKAPLPGDAPQMRIEVDTTPPAVKLFYPQPDGHRRNALVLAWSATDHSLAPNPITLQWAERPDAAWQTIATDLGNTGRYIWQPSANMPFRVYLRVMARDTAGNVAVDESPEPVLIDLLEPEGQLIGITGAVRRP